MGTILMTRQKWVDLDPARAVIVGIHQVKLLTASDTFRVPTLAEDGTNNSCRQLERTSDPTLTVEASDEDVDGGFQTITVTGTAGQEGVIVTIHEGRFNFAEDEDS